MKIMIVGGLTGKTTLVNKWKDDTFVPHYKPTLGVDVSIVGYKGICFKIWDCAGNPKNQSHVYNHYFKRADGVILVVNKYDTHDKILSQKNKLYELCPVGVFIAVICNQIDENEIPLMIWPTDLHEVVSFKHSSQKRLLKILDYFL